MTAVKGSKQYQMMVVPHRPLYKAMIFLLCLGAVSILAYSSYEYGISHGKASSAYATVRIAELEKQLANGAGLVSELRQEIAVFKLNDQVDTRANEEVQASVQTMQERIAELEEEVRFYQGVMLPNVEAKGLRIERVNLKSSADPDTIKLSLLLTQVVEKRDYVQGNVEIKVLGTQDGSERQLNLSELEAEERSSIRFRFRYFQNIDSELKVPSGFEPHQVLVVAQSSGRNGQRLEKTFDWQVSGD